MNMDIRSADTWIRASGWRRAGGVLICLWVAGVVAAALMNAIYDELELYRWTMLGLLAFGVPIAIVALIYAGSLAGPKALKFAAACAVLLTVATGFLVYLERRWETRESVRTTQQPTSTGGKDWNSIWDEVESESKQRQAVAYTSTDQQPDQTARANILDGFDELSDQIERQRHQRQHDKSMPQQDYASAASAAASDAQAAANAALSGNEDAISSGAVDHTLETPTGALPDQSSEQSSDQSYDPTKSSVEREQVPISPLRS